MLRRYSGVFFLNFFFFNDPATTEIYTLSLHDALPIYERSARPLPEAEAAFTLTGLTVLLVDRESTRLNSSHGSISYAVFCWKKITGLDVVVGGRQRQIDEVVELAFLLRFADGELEGAHVEVLFFFNDTATTEIYTLSLHDALPI